MKIVIAGGTGFLGAPLSEAFAADGHDVVILTRGIASGAPAGRIARVHWNPDTGPADWYSAVDGASAVVNLSGESIAGRRWNAEHKRRILTSRLTTTRRLVAAMASVKPSPALVNASAVGYYGDRGSETLTEASAPGRDFLAQVCVEWEAEAMKAAQWTRVALVRTGIVLERDGGALERMLLPFRLFAGGPLGSGAQYMSWIHREDWLRLVVWLTTTAVQGPFNATAPNPVTGKDFAKALGRVLKRPSLMPAPAFALKIALGEMAGPLLLASQRALPARAQEAGFAFTYPTLDEALRAILQ